MPKKILATVLIALCCAPPMAAAKERRVFVVTTIQANRSWHRVNFRLHGRGMLRFRARGRWIFNPSQPSVGGDGATNLSTAGRTNYTFSGPQGREGQLIGRIGRHKPFVAGAHGLHRMGRHEIGPLYLMIDDDVTQSSGAGLSDNSGHLTVRIEFERRIYRSTRP
jgi:hypothetical protein